MNQTDLATAIGVTPGCVAHYESGAREPSLSALVKVASRLRCSVSDLIGDSHQHAPIPVICTACDGRGFVMPNVSPTEVRG